MLIYAYICLYTSCIWVIYVFFFLVWYIIIMGFGNLHKCDGRFHWIESGPEKMIMGMDDRIPRCHSDSFVFAAGLGTTVIVQIAFISSRFVWKYETVYTVLHPTILCSIILTYTYFTMNWCNNWRIPSVRRNKVVQTTPSCRLVLVAPTCQRSMGSMLIRVHQNHPKSTRHSQKKFLPNNLNTNRTH